MHQIWDLEELARVIHAERLAEAEQYRRAVQVTGPERPVRTVIADALRAWATRLDRQSVAGSPDGRLVRVS
ncbi:MAG: hypothetical protein IT305_07455 [Chloroflexi bacterium]|nr:hypothetical protein [Chloroflexota bacterium]